MTIWSATMAEKKVSRQSKRKVSASHKSLSGAMIKTLGRMCDASAIELARLTHTFGKAGIREELLYPAVAAAGNTLSSSVLANVRQDGRGAGSPNRRQMPGPPRRSDLLLVQREKHQPHGAVLIEMKLARLTGRNISVSEEQIARTCKAKLPLYLDANLVGFVLLVVVRIPASAIKPLKRLSDEELLGTRLPHHVQGLERVAFSRFFGDECTVFSSALFIGAPVTEGEQA